MSNMDQNAQMETPLSQAANWLARLHADAGDLSVQAEFDSWLAANPMHRLAYAEAAAVWFGSVASLTPVATGAIEQKSLQPLKATSTSTKGAWRIATGWLSGAALCSLLAYGALFAPHFLQNQRADLRTAAGNTATHTLADGSVVTLDSDTALRVEMGRNGERRVALLRGAAEFVVTHDETRPFSVAVGDFDVRDLGTRFVLKRDPDGLGIEVSEGEVAWSHRGKPGANLRAGEHTYLRLDGENASLQADVGVTAEAITAWQNGQLVFANQSVATVVAELDRHLPQRLVLIGKHPQRITLLAPAADPLAALRSLADQAGLRVFRAPGVIALAR